MYITVLPSVMAILEAIYVLYCTLLYCTLRVPHTTSSRTTLTYRTSLFFLGALSPAPKHAFFLSNENRKSEMIRSPKKNELHQNQLSANKLTRVFFLPTRIAN